MQDRPTAPAVDHSIAILQLLVNASYPLTQSEISEQTGIPPASCYRILGSLLETQMVSLDPGRKRAYCIGSKIFQMASAIYSRQSILPFFHPIAEILKNEIHQTVLLSLPVGNKVVVLGCLKSYLGNGYPVHIGQTLPMHRAAAGKAILSLRADAYLDNYLDAEQRLALLDEADVQALRAQLERARRLGYATTRGEIDSATCCLAAPVADLRGDPVAAVSICVDAESLSDAQIRAYSGPLIQAARQLTARIG
ncbi:IclR family transcriptional regulator [Chromobacterium haemolyticum]|uniref:IclR family transcriptional regulator n=1 Tax=Chromobacterium haemolyticum TaxID=394935 RepID=UPI00193B95FE|nr:IclR family transcriptional regulator [Chromobacterium haemolyticum]